MTVAEFIEILKTKPQHLQVAYRCYSEWCLLEEKEIEIKTLCEPRPDGWVHDERPDKPLQEYLTLPGN
jgi:hypothetical protein